MNLIVFKFNQNGWENNGYYLSNSRKDIDNFINSSLPKNFV